MTSGQNDQIGRIESTLNSLVIRVEGLERRASFWGLCGGAVAMLITKLMGCI